MNIYKMNSIKKISSIALMGVLIGSIAPSVFAQSSPPNSNSVDREEFFEQRQVQRIERQLLRSQKVEEFKQENPELAAELEALRTERNSIKAERKAAFNEKYPEITAKLDELKENRNEGNIGRDNRRHRAIQSKNLPRNKGNSKGHRGFRYN